MTSLALKAAAFASLAGFVCAATLPTRAEDIPASPMNHGGFSMPTPASAGLEAPPPPAPAEPPMPEKPIKKKNMAKKMKRTPAPEAAAAAESK